MREQGLNTSKFIWYNSEMYSHLPLNLCRILFGAYSGSTTRVRASLALTAKVPFITG
jgi:hypothetical protein